MAKVNYIGALALMLALGCASTEIVRDTMTIQEVGDDATTAGSDSSGPVESLGPGDVFELKVFGEAELSGKFRVSGSGEVTLPLIGRVSVLTVGLTDLEELITDRLRKYLKQPQVHVFVEGCRAQPSMSLSCFEEDPCLNESCNTSQTPQHPALCPRPYFAQIEPVEGEPQAWLTCCRLFG